MTGVLFLYLKFKMTLLALVLTTMNFNYHAIANDTDPARIGPTATLTFAENKSALTNDLKAKLTEVVRSARSHGQIDEVQVAVWSDNPAPRSDEQLSRDDRELAENRVKSIRNYLKKQAKVDVSTYNMAERANWLARTFDTAEAELKDELGRGKDVTMSRDEFQIFKNNGQPSKAVVLVLMKH